MTESFAPGNLQRKIDLAFFMITSKDGNREGIKIKDDVTLTDVSSTKIEGNFFSVAITTPLAARNMTQMSESTSHSETEVKRL